jgi:hypothetical protein
MCWRVPRAIIVWVVAALVTAASAAESSPTPAPAGRKDTHKVACAPSTRRRWITVRFVRPQQVKVSAVAVRVDYPAHLVRLPGTGKDESVKRRVGNVWRNSLTTIEDTDSALRVVIGRKDGIATGELFTVEFNACVDADKPANEDFTCTLEGCANSAGAVEGCTCTVAVP